MKIGLLRSVPHCVDMAHIALMIRQYARDAIRIIAEREIENVASDER